MRALADRCRALWDVINPLTPAGWVTFVLGTFWAWMGVWIWRACT